LELGIWNLEFCRPVAPRLVSPHEIVTGIFGICDLVFGTWKLNPGLWCDLELCPRTR
jgi:hypothetical protein